ncbi:DNA/RNA nuclease SfsA [Pyrococcus yayanosii]|uniref:DNA/RNA nuclease SfsA n=1 Tax=Pyrococcus yayanosii TaxID=1008460 RepID=UPI00068E3C56|nr:DNA/RNA nuclease SfsA [Pyrococcus yayanosii]
MDTRTQARAFEKALELGLVFRGRSLVRREVSAVLRLDGYASYPDRPSARGRKHVKELIALKRAGKNAAIVFIAALPNVRAFKPNSSADPEMARLLKDASEAGVEIMAFGMHIDRWRARNDIGR